MGPVCAAEQLLLFCDTWRGVTCLKERHMNFSFWPLSFLCQALEKEVKEFLQTLSGKMPITQVNEVACSIRIKGYFDQELKTWLVDKGF